MAESVLNVEVRFAWWARWILAAALRAVSFAARRGARFHVVD